VRVGLIFGGRSVEHRVSLSSARSVAAGLAKSGHEVLPLAVAQDGCWLGPEESAAALKERSEALAPLGVPIAPTLRHLLTAQAEVLFPLIHGTWGEDGSLQGLCEMIDLPYVGAGVAASAVGMDKQLSKRLWRQQGIPVVRDEVIVRADLEAGEESLQARLAPLGMPVFVKPCVGGSSVGVKRVDRPADLMRDLDWALQFDDRLLVEQAIVGRELECAVLGYRRLRASAIGEIVPSQEFYDYDDKYILDAAGLHVPADIPPAMADRLRDLAVRAFAAVGGWGMARVDFLVGADDTIHVNEVNTLPGFTSISMYPKLWAAAGFPLPSLVDRLVQIAVRRHHDRAGVDQGIKDWLARGE